VRPLADGDATDELKRQCAELFVRDVRAVRVVADVLIAEGITEG
jgi:hypothetical protein